MNAEEMKYQVYGYRWIILLMVFLITVTIAIQWLTFAPIAREARIAYDASALQIDLLSMLFMIVFILVCIPASYVLDRFGIRIGIGIGAALTGVFGLMKGIFAPSYAMMVVCQVGLGVAQPFILNSATKVAAKWFPMQERATAVGVATLAQFLGFVVVMVATPILVAGSGADGIGTMLVTYGILSMAGAVLFLVFMREEPPTPPGQNGGKERLLSLDGFKHIIRLRDMKLMLALFFIGLGLFNAVSTGIDQICEIKGLNSEQSGMIMGMMLIAGIIGALILPLLSDKIRRRKPFITWSMALMLPGFVGLAVADNYTLMLASAAVIGFFLLGAGAPIGFQYAAELSHPAPESLSQGLILFVGQISGILFLFAMDLIGMIPSLYVFIALAVVNVVISLRMQESPISGRGIAGSQTP
jgi:sugar phosphate permease